MDNSFGYLNGLVYLHGVHVLVITSLKYMAIHQLKTQMSAGNSTCPLDPTLDKQNSNGHFQVHWIHWIQWTIRLAISMALYIYMTSMCLSLRPCNTWYEKNGIVVAILFRGLPNANERDFSEWANNLGYEPFSYVGGVVPRNEIEPNVSEGAQDDSVITFEPHNEMAYSPRFPKIFSISCLKKSQWGGETAICDNRDFHVKLDPAFVQKCEDREIRYWNCLHSKDSYKNRYQSWQMRFKTEDKDNVNDFLKSQNYHYSWEENTLFYWKNLSPTKAHPISGKQLWFNQLSSVHASYYDDIPSYEDLRLAYKEYPAHTTYGDGEEFAEHEIDNHRRCIWESAVGFDWQNGDILFLDQMIVQHSRLSFQGDRRVGVSLLNY
ncbi:Clavaminate synthase [Paramuricea clavata]|uniref:Clavaminate synthase n=1 Tax=Paramuricea clavata TaxID=317549 RepID=A0A7D9I1K5_PARCT|nr:Clavaminate synthase [Paramuricea clavata]